MDGIGGLKAQKREFSFAERRERASLRAALYIQQRWEETGQTNSNYVTGLFYPDDFALVGRSVACGVTGNHREHVVPNILVVRECEKRFEHGHTLGQVALLIRKYVLIVQVTKEESYRLDRRTPLGLGLKMTMPGGIHFEEKPFARLREGGITWNWLDTDAARLTRQKLQN